MPTNEDGLAHIVTVAVVDGSFRGPKAHPVPRQLATLQVSRRRHVNQCIGALGTNDVFGGAFAQIDLVHVDPFRSCSPRASIDAYHVVLRRHERVREQLPQLAGNPRHDDFHNALYSLRPESIKLRISSRTLPTATPISSSLSCPVPSSTIGLPNRNSMFTGRGNAKR